MNLTQSRAYQALAAHHRDVADVSMRSLFAEDTRRFETMSLELDGILFDYSKHRATNETLALLIQLAEQAELGAFIERMFTGERINVTEDRAVLHTALRNRSNTPVLVDGKDVMPEVNERMAVILKQNPVTQIPADILLIFRVLGLMSGLQKRLDSRVNMVDTILPYANAQANDGSEAAV